MDRILLICSEKSIRRLPCVFNIELALVGRPRTRDWMNQRLTVHVSTALAFGPHRNNLGVPPNPSALARRLLPPHSTRLANTSDRDDRALVSMGRHSRQDRRGNKILLVSLLVQAVGFSVFPFLRSPEEFVLVVSLMGLFSSSFIPVYGAMATLSNRQYGRAIGGFWTTAAYFTIIYFVTNVAVVTVLWILPIYPLIQSAAAALMSDYTSAAYRGKGLGLLESAISLGGGLGPLAGGLIADAAQLQAVIVFSLAVALASVVSSQVLLKEKPRIAIAVSISAET
jgi:MFS family permease